MPWKNTFLLKKQDSYLELPLQHFATGIEQVRLILFALHPEHVSTIIKCYKTLTLAVRWFMKKKKLLTVELAPKNNLMTLNDKKLFSNPTTLLTLWLKTSVLELIGKEKVLKPFWTKECEEISQKLWLPTETDCVDSHLNSSKTYLKQEALNSLSWTETNINPEILNSPKTFSPSCMFIHVDKWANDGIKTKKIRIYPTVNQRLILKQWIGTSRYVYNKALDTAKKLGKYNFYTLRNKVVTAKNNDNIKSWELETPKDVRAGAVKDMTIAFSAAMTNLKRRNISSFKLGFRSKKLESSIVIPKSAIEIHKHSVCIYKRYLGHIKTSKDKVLNNLKIDHDCRLKNDKGRWFLYIPVKEKMVNNEIPQHGVCALDPGVRKFQTVYSEYETKKIIIDKEILKTLLSKLDTFQSLRSKKEISKSHYVRRHSKLQFRLSNLIDDLHYKTISYLIRTYDTIFLPSFESQELVRKNKSKICRRNMLTMKHYTFKQRFIHKCDYALNTNLFICTEEYTSKTCSRCGLLNDVKSSEVYSCKRCNLVMDRDINGARNILIKSLQEQSG